MNDRDPFDEQITQSLEAGPPPADVVECVTPFRTATRRITAGLVLCLFNINILWLPHILPAIGALLLFLGLRTLRRENGGFRLCWILSCIKMPLYLLTLLRQTAPLWGGGFDVALTAVNCLWMLLLFISYGAGLNAAVRGATGGNAGTAGPAVSAALWYLAMLLAGLTDLGNSWLIFLPLVLWYILTARALWRRSRDLEGWGYTVQAAPVRLNGGTVKLAWCAALALVFLTGCLFLARTPVRGAPQAETRADAARLEALGVPADILADLSDDDIALLSQAERICASPGSTGLEDPCIHRNSFSLGRKLFSGPVQNDPQREHYTVDVSSFVAQLPDGQLLFLGHFSWADAPVLSWEEAFRLNLFDYSEFRLETAAGRLLWTQNGQALAADMPLSIGSRTQENIFWGQSAVQCAEAAFSFPHSSENRRGYILAQVSYQEASTSHDVRWLFGYTFELYHKNQPFHLPYPDPLAQLGGNSSGYAPARAQHYATADMRIP